MNGRNNSVCGSRREFERLRYSIGRFPLNLITGFFDQVRVRVIEGELLARFDPHDVMFFNANTPAGYEQARRMLEGMSS
ncbi:MAG: hypothetical protein ACRERE_35160 [Candidatus Entotheonellia bacterium]